MNMTSNYDVTNSAYQIQMTTVCHGMKIPYENFLRTPLHFTFLSVGRTSTSHKAGVSWFNTCKW